MWVMPRDWRREGRVDDDISSFASSRRIGMTQLVAWWGVVASKGEGVEKERVVAMMVVLGRAERSLTMARPIPDKRRKVS